MSCPHYFERSVAWEHATVVALVLLPLVPPLLLHHLLLLPLPLHRHLDGGGDNAVVDTRLHMLPRRFAAAAQPPPPPPPEEYHPIRDTYETREYNNENRERNKDCPPERANDYVNVGTHEYSHLRYFLRRL